VTRERSQDIRDRTFLFGCTVARLTLDIAPRPGVRCLVDQLLKAATSVGANLEEAKAASSRREFIRYAEIALREARESVYWLRMCESLSLLPPDECARMRNEGDQIARILAAIVLNAKAATAS
jgi:four helix bundle protein